MKIDEIIEMIRNNEVLTPGELAEYKLQLSAEYGYVIGLLDDILRKKPDEWVLIRNREDVSSDKQADREWEASENGKNEMSCKYTLKRIEKVMSGINTKLRAYEQEAKNNI